MIPGLRVTVPAGWTSSENNPANFILNPEQHPKQMVFFFLNMAAVKSTGAGHGTTVLTKVGRTPSALIGWLTTNPDFRVLASPARASVGRVAMKTLIVGVSSTARYRDPGCPANPHCADLFTNPDTFGMDFYGIGGHEVVRLFLGHAHAGNIMIGLDANNPAALKQLETSAKPILDSVRFP